MNSNFNEKHRISRQNVGLSAKELARIREDEIISRKKKEIEALESKSFYFSNSKSKKEKEAVAYTLPLECWGFK